MARIFLSYAREDAASAKTLAEAIAAHGHKAWWDEHIRGGARFAAEIGRELDAADVVIVLWSAAAIVSPWVLDEAAEGRDTGRLLPVALDGCKPPLGFRQFQTVAMAGSANGSDWAVEKVIDAIAGRDSESSSEEAKPQARRSESRPRLSVCVLPFANIGGDPEQDYFSDGMTEDVITDLSNVSSLEVIARNTACAYKGQSVDVKEIASAHGATHVVEGSVRKSGSRVRITAQLLEAATARHLWAERYDRELTDIFAIQDEISTAIVEALELKLLPNETKAIEARSTSDAEAYDLYLQARKQWVRDAIGNAQACEEVVRLCGQSIQLDRDYARAWALMALAQSDLRFWHDRDEDPSIAANRALSIDFEIPEPRCVKASLLHEAGDEDGAREEIDTALRLKPELWEAHRQAGRLALANGRIDEAVASFERAAAAMKTDHDSAAVLVFCYHGSDDRDGVRRSAESAVARAERVVISNPKNGAAFASGACGLAALGHADRSKKWLRKALNADPGNLAMRYRAGSILAALLNDPEAALDTLEPFVEVVRKPPHVALLENDPGWNSLRELPRFQQLLAKARKRVEAFQPAASVRARSSLQNVAEPAMSAQHPAISKGSSPPPVSR